ncbi:MAG: cyclopropane-fatty-acyl-phospholipid synthase family protein [Pseudomonadota bacterium]
MWERLFDRMLRNHVQHAHIKIRMPSGVQIGYGPGPDTGLSIAIKDTATLRQILTAPELGIGEAYMDGRLLIENDDLDGFMRFISRNADTAPLGGLHAVSRWLGQVRRRIDQRNPVRRARANVAHHYDLSAALYDLFLDRDRQYSCAYFSRPGMDLEDAQAAKKAHIARKLILEPDMEVLDIGCGWGGMALTLARDYGVRVWGVTLSEEQHRIALSRAAKAGLSDRVRFELRDYRDIDRSFDRVVSVGMFEHVGVPHYPEYFDKLRRLLRPEAVALIHTIGRSGPPGHTSPWVAKYIFPGGYVPALSEMSAAIEGAGLINTDTEVWRLHYAETLKIWHDRFVARESEACALYDGRFCRMWRYYLKACEYSFRLRGHVVFQVQFAQAQSAVPLTRDYLYPAAQHHLSAAE